MKKFKKQEIRDLLNQVYHEEISFSRMVEILNEMVSEAEKKCVEDIPKRKFKNGDKVRIKDGISSRTAQGNHPSFQPSMDGFIGITMTVSGYTDECGYVVCEEAGWRFHEEWLEPYTDELKKGDLAIFWNGHPKDAIIRLFDRYISPSDLFSCVDKSGSGWKNAIKFESVEQYERFINGEI